MNAAQLLDALEAQGVRVSLIKGGRVGVYPWPPPDLAAELAPRVAEVAALLERRDRTWTADPPAMPWGSQVGEDPRPDLPGSALWARLLQLASGDAADPYGVYGRLLGARACGAVLERRGRSWKLTPTVDPSERLSVWADQAAWDADAERWLRPRAAEITALLRHLPPIGAEVGVPR